MPRANFIIYETENNNLFKEDKHMCKTIKNFKERWKELPKSKKYERIGFIFSILVVLLLIVFSGFEAKRGLTPYELIVKIIIVIGIIANTWICYHFLSRSLRERCKEEHDEEIHNRVMEFFKDNEMVEVGFLLRKLLNSYLKDGDNIFLKDVIINVYNYNKSKINIYAQLEEDNKITILFIYEDEKNNKKINDFPKEKFLEYFYLK